MARAYDAVKGRGENRRAAEPSTSSRAEPSTRSRGVSQLPADADQD
ncbi:MULTISPECIES: hypothetical protein [Streptosporangium]|uniref:Uncharacterized protein n=1 Tax=Streptosporangium brasiliense TaxID=47480 RepID=A0ABT9R143_9ACTN|nr:hypothetical protein [Streptosporangium brasiliense]MDP9862611.1 hypothetical protein [Streptosporangium brasiliense]